MTENSLTQDDQSPRQLRKGIEELEEFLLTQPQIMLKTRHYFTKGLYAREMHLPASVVATGAVHKREHFFIVAKGLVRVVDGDDATEVDATNGPVVITSHPGVKRACFALQDAVFITLHATEATTVEDAEADLVAADHAGTPYISPERRRRIE